METTFDAKDRVERLEALTDPKVILEDIKARLLMQEITPQEAKIEIQRWNKSYLTTPKG